MKKPKIITICNRKGGTGKTSVAINLAAYLSRLGHKVLLIDLDPQSNATSGLGVDNRRSGIYEVLSGDASFQEIIMAARGNLWLAPASENLAGAEVEIVGRENRESILRKSINSFIEKQEIDIDFILIDTAPSLSLITINSLVAADQILIPVQTEYFALEGLTQLCKTIDLVKEGLQPNLSILGAVLTMYDGRNKLSSEIWQELYRHFPYYIFRTVIPRNVRLAEAPSYGQSVLEYAPRSRGAKAFHRLAKEFLALSLNNKINHA
ncbi:ParA family protein [Patescibacteria group bacterium]|nr:ParA family protein [Patescibacteria group bacterium]